MKYSFYTVIIILFSTMSNYFVSKPSQNKIVIENTPMVRSLAVDRPAYLNATSIDYRQQVDQYKPSWFLNLEPKLVSLDKELIELKQFDFKFKTSLATEETLRDDEIDKIEAIFNKLPIRSNLTSEKGNNDQSQDAIIEPDYWTTLYSVETKQGALLYRPRNKYKSCTTTASPCGHHQLSLQALKDIGCSSKQCKKDREDYAKSLFMSKQLQEVNEKRLNKAGISHLPEYQQYLVHQQGASGIKKIIAASKGKKTLSNSIKRNMANNSPYSYKSLKRMGSKQAAIKFMQHWKQKWEDEKDLIRVSQLNLKTQKIFNEYELNIALNLNLRY